MVVLVLSFVIIPLIAMCYLCDFETILLLIPWGIITFFFAGIGIICVYRQAFAQDISNPFHGGKIMRGIKFAVGLCFYSSISICYIIICQFRFDTLWIVAIVYYCLIVICFFLVSILSPPDPAIKDNFDKIRWLDVIHKDILTSDATEEDWHRPRGDEDWHGL